MLRRRLWKVWLSLVALAVSLGGAGCQSAGSLRSERECCKPPDFNCCTIPDVQVPKELNKVSLPPYVVETPDVLQIDAIRVIPLPPYRLEPLDVLPPQAGDVVVTVSDGTVCGYRFFPPHLLPVSTDPGCRPTPIERANVAGVAVHIMRCLRL